MNDRSHLCTPGRHTRREFLKRSALITAGAGFASPWLLDLARLGAASADDGYRATVCLFLFGGNDTHNTFIPTDDTSFNTYSAARGGIGVPRSSALTIEPDGGWASERQMGFAPEMPNLHRLFRSRELAIISNIGTLLQPLDKEGYRNGEPRPRGNFSHSDSQTFWQTSTTDNPGSGWSGRTADMILDGNGERSMFTSISVAGNTLMMQGETALQYRISDRGVNNLQNSPFYVDRESHGSPFLPADALRDVMMLQTGGLFADSYSTLARRSLESADAMAQALSISDASYGGPLGALFDPPDGSTNDLRRVMSQLHMVARLIGAGRDVLGLKRQVFFVSMGGFDTHGNQNNRHPDLLGAIDGGLSRFFDATRVLGAVDEVVTFTASDFSRTLDSNGDGTDHGWGGHHVVLGGSVDGRRVIGDLPILGIDGPADVGRGRLVPYHGVDQLASTLGRWMGVSDSDLSTVAPNIDRFPTRDLGLFRSAAGIVPRGSDMRIDGPSSGTFDRPLRGG
ncbi:MAG: DUF1501 domain-containing protein [Actinomycetota bacterium]